MAELAAHLTDGFWAARRYASRTCKASAPAPTWTTSRVCPLLWLKAMSGQKRN